MQIATLSYCLFIDILHPGIKKILYLRLWREDHCYYWDFVVELVLLAELYPYWSLKGSLVEVRVNSVVVVVAVVVTLLVLRHLEAAVSFSEPLCSTANTNCLSPESHKIRSQTYKVSARTLAFAPIHAP